MREAFAQKGLDYVSKYNTYDEIEKIKIKYGLEVFYTIVTKTTGILILSLFLKTFKETVLLMLLYMSLRLFGHGIHANKSSQCWIVSIITYGIFPLLIKNIVISQKYIYIMWLISFICFILWAPADTPKKPLINKKKRLFDKAMTLLFSLILLILTIYTSQTLIDNSIFFALVMSIVSINPLTYKLFNIPFNNYKNIKN